MEQLPKNETAANKTEHKRRKQGVAVITPEDLAQARALADKAEREKMEALQRKIAEPEIGVSEVTGKEKEQLEALSREEYAEPRAPRKARMEQAPSRSVEVSRETSKDTEIVKLQSKIAANNRAEETLKAQIKEAESRASVWGRLAGLFSNKPKSDTVKTQQNLAIWKDKLASIDRQTLQYMEDLQDLKLESALRFAQGRAGTRGQKLTSESQLAREREAREERLAAQELRARGGEEAMPVYGHELEEQYLGRADEEMVKQSEAAMESDFEKQTKQRIKDKAYAEALERKQKAAETEEPNVRPAGLRKVTGRRGPDVRLASQKEIAEKVRLQRFAGGELPGEEAELVKAEIGTQFEERRRASKKAPEMTPQQVNALVEAEREKNNWEGERPTVYIPGGATKKQRGEVKQGMPAAEQEEYFARAKEIKTKPITDREMKAYEKKLRKAKHVPIEMGMEELKKDVAIDERQKAERAAEAKAAKFEADIAPPKEMMKNGNNAERMLGMERLMNVADAGRILGTERAAALWDAAYADMSVGASRRMKLLEMQPPSENENQKSADERKQEGATNFVFIAARLADAVEQGLNKKIIASLRKNLVSAAVQLNLSKNPIVQELLETSK